jgi:RNA polymerase sigma-70 factor (ECF subfamily)
MTIPLTHVSLLCDLKGGVRQAEAWAVFHDRYRDVILGWCLRRGLPHDAAEDLTQDVLVKLFRKLPEYTHDPAQGRFRSWLKTVVNNAVIDSLRRRRATPEPAGGVAELEILAGPPGAEDGDELSGLIEDRARRAANEALDRVRGRVKDTTWRAFYLTLVDQRPTAEIARELGLSAAAVYKAAYRVKEMVLDEYRRAHPGPPT